MTMSTRPSWNRAAAVAFFTGALMLLGASDAWSERNRNPGVHPIGSKPYGVTYPEWAARWAQWFLSVPAAQNPFLDPDGRFCQVGQSAPVFFLGSNGGGDSVRNCDVRPGQSVLFSPGGLFCLVGLDVDTEGELRPCVEDFLPLLANVSADIDGKPIRDLERYLVITEVFTATLPSDNLFGLPAGEYKGLLGGYFFIHTPLAKGEHVIHFHDEIPDFGFVSDVTYVLNVGVHH